MSGDRQPATGNRQSAAGKGVIPSEARNLGPANACGQPESRADARDDKDPASRDPQPATRLTTEGLVKSYRGRRVVDGVSLEVRPGEIVGLLGPNGAGKTTSFYAVVGLIRPDRGKVVLDTKEITRWPMYRRARAGIGYLAQEPSAFRRLTVEQNLLAVLERMPLARAERLNRANQLLEEFHLSHLRRSPAQVLSGGERRRLEIARALAGQPEFILLDEPFTGVDPIAVADIKELLQGLREKGIGILLTDQSVRETLDVTDRAYIIYQGQILTSGASALLPEDPVARKFYLGERFQL